MDVLNELPRWIGANSNDIAWWQMSIRAVVVFLFGLVLFGLMRRAFRQRTTIDVVIGVILGSMLSRTITGNAPLLPVLGASAVLVFLHNAIAWLACRSGFIDRLVKQDEPIPLVRDGRIDRKGMLKGLITHRDLESAVRQHGMEDLEAVQTAYLEPTGAISIIKKSP